MLRFLFPRLTPQPKRGAALFQRVVSDARQPHWYAELGVPDTLDGRFSVLATVTALVLVRLEGEGAGGTDASVALTEQFVESMDHEHRQLGYGDPTIGKIVRRLTGSLAGRVERFREVTGGSDASWPDAAAASLKGLAEPDDPRAKRAGEALQRLWRAIDSTPLTAVEAGDWA